MEAVRTLHGQGRKASLNRLAEHIPDEGGATAIADDIVESVRAIREQGLGAHVSVKLTGIGLDLDESLCKRELSRIMDCACEAGVFVRIDMEESAYTQRTVTIFEEFQDRYGEAAIGIVLQSYLHDHGQTLERMNRRRARIRLVKGGYREPAEVAMQGQAEIDAAYLEDIETALAAGHQPAIATHDAAAISWARRVQAQHGLDASAFEFQMLYGIRRDLQRSLVDAGYSVRCYLPYGGHFMGYVLGSLRRLPAGLLRGRASRLR